MFNKTLVCLDGSKLGEEILPYVIGHCLGLKSEIILLRVITAGITIPPLESSRFLKMRKSTGSPQTSPSDIENSSMVESKAGLQLGEIEREQGEAKVYLNNIADQLRSKDLKVKTVTLQGDIGETILDYASGSQVSLIALTTHGNGGLKHGLIGRVAQHILKESEFPVLIVKPRGNIS